jgi:hypothetical protein
MEHYNEYLDPDVPKCTCADWGMMGCLSTCAREIYVARKKRELKERQQLEKLGLTAEVGGE